LDTRKTFNKGQVFTWDLISSVMLFLIALGMLIYLMMNLESDILYSQRIFELGQLGSMVNEQLVRTPGVPSNWNASNASVFGFAKSFELMGKQSALSRTLDPAKILSFAEMASQNYSSARHKLLGSSKYEFYLEISCLNKTSTDCFYNLRIDGAGDRSVECQNGFDFTIHNGITDSHLWIEAENYWDNQVIENCGGNCPPSNALSRVDGDQTEKFFATTPKTHTAWVRSYDDNEDRKFRLVINGINSKVLGRHGNPEGIRWEFAGTYDLGTNTSISFTDTTDKTLIDAVLITTNSEYDPNDKNPPFGNPTEPKTCMIGNLTAFEQAVEIVSDTKTATFYGTPGTGKTVNVRLALWYGVVGQPSGIPITTTLPTRVSLPCIGNATHNCSTTYDAVKSVDSIDAPAELTCGNKSAVTVNWSGFHFNVGRNPDNPNYFAFFIDGKLVDTCFSYNRDDQVVVPYTMSCFVNIPERGFANGSHALTVTAEDEGGYCNINESGMDAMRSINVTLVDCNEYLPLSCTNETKVYEKCSGSRSVEKISRLEIPDAINCDTEINVSVAWTGWHNRNPNYFAFFIDNAFIHACESKLENYAAEYNDTKYDMDCKLTIPHISGTHNLTVTSEDDEGYCTPGNPGTDAEKTREIVISCAG